MERKERRGEQERVPESKNERQRQQQQQQRLRQQQRRQRQQQQWSSNGSTAATATAASAAAATTATAAAAPAQQLQRRRQQHQQQRRQHWRQHQRQRQQQWGRPPLFLSFRVFLFIYLASTSGGSRLVVYPPFPSCLNFPPIPFSSSSLIAFTIYLLVYCLYLQCTYII
jgi:cation transport ATPase